MTEALLLANGIYEGPISMSNAPSETFIGGQSRLKLVTDTSHMRKISITIESDASTGGCSDQGHACSRDWSAEEKQLAHRLPKT